MFQTVPLSTLRSFSLYIQQWYMSYRFADSSRAGSGRNCWSCSQAVSKLVRHIPLLCVQWKTPVDGRTNCPKHVEFYSKNKFEKLVHLVGFIIRIDHDAQAPERQNQWCVLEKKTVNIVHILTYLLPPWCRVLLEKLTGLQLVKKFPAFHGIWRFITALTSVCHLSLSWASPIQSIYPHPTSWSSILILSTQILYICIHN